MEAGKLSNKIKFIKKVKATSETGAVETEEKEILDTRFKNVKQSGKTDEEANEIQFHLYRIIELRYNKLIAKDCFCIIDDQKFKIDSLIKDKQTLRLYLDSLDK